MRFYTIKVTKKDGSIWIPPSMKALGATDVSYTSFYKGQTMTSALDIGLDLPMSNRDAPDGGALVQVYGIGLADLSQSNNLIDGRIEIHAGMKKGLPLAIPKMPDLLVKGYIDQCFGQWQGPNTAINFVLREGDANPAISQPNLSFNWPDNTPLSQAIETTLRNAYQNPELKITISDKLKVKGQRAGYYGTLDQFATAIRQFSLDKQFAGLKRADGTAYTGVSIRWEGDTLIVSDGTSTTGTTGSKQIDFIDLIGQPTWIDTDTIQVKTMLRGDIRLEDVVKLPASLRSPFVATTAAGAQFPGDPLPSSDPLVFQGDFLVDAMHHFAHFRQASADSWATTFDLLAPAPKDGTTKPISEAPGGTTKQQPKAVPPKAPTPADQPFA